MDFGFDSNGELDTVAIKAWLGSATGYVRTIYDQSGNLRDFTNTNNNTHPELLINGVNGKPTLKFASNDQLRMTQDVFNWPLTIIGASKLINNNCGRVFGGANNNWLHGFYNNRMNVFHYEDWKVFDGDQASNLTGMIHSSINHSNTSNLFYSNGTLLPYYQDNSNRSVDPPDGLTLNGYGNGSQESNVYILEFIVYGSAISKKNLINVEREIALRYDIPHSQTLVLDSISGALDISNSADGDYLIQYLTSLNSCSDSSTFVVSINTDTIPIINTGYDRSICQGSEVILNGSAQVADTIYWDDNIINNVPFTPTSTSTYTLNATNQCYSSSDSITISLVNYVDINLQSDTSLCYGDSILLDAGPGHNNYLWNTGETDQTIYVSSSGIYSVIADNGTLQNDNYSSLFFDGGDDYVISSNLNNFPSTNITVEMWLKTNNQNSDETPFSYAIPGTDNELWIYDLNNLRLRCFGGGNINTGVSFDDGLYHHLAFTWTSISGEGKIYKDGIVQWTGNFSSGQSFGSGGTLVFGQDQDALGGSFDGNQAFSGNLDEVRIWNRVLNDTEINNKINSCLYPTLENGLSYYWKFNEMVGNYTNDLTINAVNGLINGPSWSSETPVINCSSCPSMDTVQIIVNNQINVNSAQPHPQIPDFNYLGDYDNKHVYFHPGSLSWNAARQKAQNNGGDLIVIKSQADQSYFESVITQESWIGLFQNFGSSNFSEPNGGWEWVDGTALIWDGNSYSGFENWSPGNPDNSGGQQYGKINFNGAGLWDDDDNNPNRSFAMVLEKISNINDVSCKGGNDGQTYITVSGGSPPYSYLWNDINNQITDTAFSLYAGSYNATVTDNNGCIAYSPIITIDEPSSFLSTNISGTNTTCNGSGSDGSVILSVNGGSPPYNVSWSNGHSTILGGTSNNNLIDSIIGLSAGFYVASITDANGCLKLDSIEILAPPSLVSPTITTSNISCNGLSDGSANIVPNGGSPPYTFVWNNGQNSPFIFGLSSGSYSVSVTDANGCNSISNINISEPPILASSITSSNNVTCTGLSDGNATVNATGGVAPFSYLWGNGQTSQTAVNLGPGNYNVVIIDSNGCNSLTSVLISEPSSLTSSISNVNNVSCSGASNGSASVYAFGGTPPYSYIWNNGQTSSSAYGLGAGNYNINVIDANGCESSNNVNITTPTGLSFNNINISEISCKGANDGEISINISGGTSPYNYSWSHSSNETSNIASNLNPGYYAITVNDLNGCTISDTISLVEPTQLTSLILQSSNLLCENDTNGLLIVTASGGTIPYSYFWSDGQTTDTAINLRSGVYNVNVTDVNGCSSSSVSQINAPPSLNSTIIETNQISCFGASDGSLVINSIGGTAPYTYLWDSGVDSTTLNGLSAGTYFVTTTDANGCTILSSSILDEPTQLNSAIISTNNVSCSGGSDGSAMVGSIGGTAPYTYLWDNNQSNNLAVGLSSGNYSVTTIDANGCLSSTNANIYEPSAMTAIITENGTISCNGGTDGQLYSNVSGGTAPYSLLWDNGDTTPLASGLSAGIHNIIVTDVNSCISIFSSFLHEPSLLVSSVSNISNVSCNGFSDGFATVSVSGGTAPYSYSWDNGQTSNTAIGLMAGNYNISITDLNGCSSTSTATIAEPIMLTSSITSTNDVSCNGGSDGSAVVSASGGTAPYTYLWTNGDTNETSIGLSIGTQNVIITDINGCSSISSAIINEPVPLLSSIIDSNDVSCNGGIDGSATVSASGGPLLILIYGVMVKLEIVQLAWDLEHIV